MVTSSKAAVPKQGDRVSSAQHQGVFEVVGVNALMQSANIRLADGSGPVIPNLPWNTLKILGKK
jgi:hypothetical protein